MANQARLRPWSDTKHDEIHLKENAGIVVDLYQQMSMTQSMMYGIHTSSINIHQKQTSYQ